MLFLNNLFDLEFTIVWTSLLALFAFVHYVHANFLNEQENRSYVAKALSEVSFRERYETFLSRLLNYLDKTIGKPFSLKRFGVCLTLAAFYPIVFMFLAWLFSNQAYELAGEPFLASAALWQRILLVLVFFSLPFMTSNVYRFGLYLETKIDELKPRRSLLLRLVIALAVALLFLFLGLPWWVVVAFASAVAVVVVFAFAGAIAIAFTNTVDAFSLTIILFFALLPLFNALLDFLSFAVSRVLARRIANGERWYWASLWLIADIAFAVLFLVALTVLLPLGLALFNKLTGNMTIDWLSYVELAKTDPWGAGFIVTAMLLSTLIPTLIHFAIALVSFVMPRLPWAHSLIALLNKEKVVSLKSYADTWVLLGSAALFVIPIYMVVALIY